MAITGLTLPTTTPSVSSRSNVDEAVEMTIQLLTRLGVVSDEPSLRESLSSDYQRLARLGDGRLYVELPAAITFNQLLKLANECAAERGFESVYRWHSFWMPGTEKDSVTEEELNSDIAGFTARIALFAEDSSYDPLLWFTGLPFDDRYRQKGQLTQLESFELTRANRPAGTSLRFADARDFLVWYIMDMLRGVSRKDVVLAQVFMRVPGLGRRAVYGGSFIGVVCSAYGQAKLDGSDGEARGVCGVGLSAGFEA